MSIKLYTGFVGSGKSFAATKLGVHVAEHPLGNDWVLANFPIKPRKRSKLARFLFPKGSQNKPSRWIYKENDEITVDYLIRLSIEKRFYQREGSCLVILDEAGIMFNSRDWQASGDERKRWVKFFTQSRKFGYDFILITQSSTMIDKQIRVNCENEVVHKKANNFSIFALLPWTLFVGVEYWNGIKNATGNSTWTFYSKKVADRYDTMALFGSVLEEVQGLGIELPADLVEQVQEDERGTEPPEDATETRRQPVAVADRTDRQPDSPQNLPHSVGNALDHINDPDQEPEEQKEVEFKL